MSDRLSTSDPATMRALAHPLRLDLLDLLGDGPLTATQCAEATGESVASCAYHLGTLAKYETAGQPLSPDDRVFAGPNSPRSSFTSYRRRCVQLHEDPFGYPLQHWKRGYATRPRFPTQQEARSWSTMRHRMTVSQKLNVQRRRTLSARFGAARA